MKFEAAGRPWPKNIETLEQKTRLVDVYTEKLEALGVNKNNYRKHSLKAWDTVRWFPAVSDFTDGPISSFNGEVL